MKDKGLALIFSTVWPEPNSSAAGVRQIQWIQFLKNQGFRVVLASPSKQKGEGEWGSLSQDLDVQLLPIPLNQSSIKETLKDLKPNLVLFDRFILEEQFGHFVYEAVPDALVLLETIDLHFVRRARDSVKDQFLSLTDIPKTLYQTETALRETGSIERVDFSVVVSSFEENLLHEQFDFTKDQVAWIPFFYDEAVIEKSFAIPFQDRNSFVWIGNFRHGPNLDGLRWFRNEIWPRIRLKLPGASLKIYGAYPTKEVMQWNQPEKNGILVLGSVEKLETVFMNARVNLAPLRYGAGIKGKILEGFRFGVPAVTTKVGVEGLLPIHSSLVFGGTEANTVQEFSEACIALYQDQELWTLQQHSARVLMNKVYRASEVEPMLAKILDALLEQKKNGALPRWRSRVFRHELMNSHKYFSKWIEEKEKT